MKLRHHCLFLLAVLVASTVGQNEDELHIPDENDNQFPPDNHSELDGSVIEGSGTGAIEEPLEVTTQFTAPLIEEVQLTSLTNNAQPTAPKSDSLVCPTPCTCNIEGGSNNYVVDCSGHDLTEFPTALDSRTTTLNVQSNKITQIPKEVAALKSLKVLNANNNSIMELALGSISELPELTTLKLANNRLIEYPNDLKNGFAMTKLEELDLGGNDMRTILTSENFSNFKALRQLTLPSSTAVLIEDLCRTLKDSLENVCTGSCSEQTYECPDGVGEVENNLLNEVLPATIPLIPTVEDSAEPAIQTETKTTENTATTTEEPVKEPAPTTNAPAKESAPTTNSPTDVSTDGAKETSEPSLRSAPEEQATGVSTLNGVIENPAVTSTGNESDVAVGATTADTKTGGVDKSLIGMIVAGMVVVVAGITIKKNWSSIKNKFSSQRPPNDRVGANANGTTPEEVPLQEKSPV